MDSPEGNGFDGDGAGRMSRQGNTAWEGSKRLRCFLLNLNAEVSYYTVGFLPLLRRGQRGQEA